MVTSISSIKQCAICNKQATAEMLLKTCAKCKAIYYCSVACQKEHWPTHKTTCAPPLAPIKTTSALPRASISFIPRMPLTPTTSGYSRFLNTLLDAQEQGLTGPGQEIWVPGPGRQMLGGKAHCPQMAEALRLWDQCHFTVLDNNPEVLNSLMPIDNILSHQYIAETILLNEDYLQLPDAFADVMFKLTAYETGQNAVTLQLFVMGAHDPSSLPDANVILATYSLLYPMKAKFEDSDPQARMKLFAQYLAKLKPGGILYVDERCVFVLSTQQDELPSKDREMVPSPPEIDQVVRQIREQYGVSCEWRKLPMAIQHELEGEFYVIQPYRKGDAKHWWAETCNAYAFTRHNFSQQLPNSVGDQKVNEH